MKATYHKNNLLDTMWGDFFKTPEADQLNVFIPKVDIYNEKSHLVVTAEMPGLAAKDIKVEIKEGILIISGNKKETQIEENGMYRSERCYGEFQRNFRLGELVDEANISARLEYGVLKLELPKLPEATPREIKVNQARIKAE